MNMWSSAQMPPRQSQKSVESIAELSMFRVFSFKGGEKYSQANKQTNKQTSSTSQLWQRSVSGPRRRCVNNGDKATVGVFIRSSQGGK